MTSPTAIQAAVYEFVTQSDRPVLFAGAGVSARAGLPTWDVYLTRLAEQTHPRDPFTLHLMKRHIDRRQFALAAEYFFLSDGLTDGEKLAALRDLLSGYDASAVVPLAALTFSSFVTTNYDRVLHDAYAEYCGRAPAEVNLNDPTMKAAPFEEGFYIARLHGRVEAPDTMVLSKTHYEQLSNNTAYVDFLRHLFTTRSLLFVGFSFLDPAIQTVLNTVREQIGPVHAGRHVALVDDDADGEFLAQLNRHNIRLVRYSPADGHSELWLSLERVPSHVEPDANALADSGSDAFAYTRQYLAAALTRKRLGTSLRPLTQAVAEGIVLEVIRHSGDTGISQDHLRARLAQQLSLSASAAADLLGRALQGLSMDSLISHEAGGIFTAAARTGGQTTLSDAIGVLVSGAVKRLVVRENGGDTAEIRSLLAEYFEYLVLRRGWDMGAAYAARRPPQVVLVGDLLAHLCRERRSDSRPERPLVRAVEDVLINPSEEEASVLAELGRLAFALELVRKAPQDTLFSSHVLPRRIYLDANVLMPAIVEGHPYNQLYSAAIEKLLAALLAASSPLDVVASDVFLNEIVSHRHRAIEELESYGDRAAEHIERDIRLYGSTNLNVFISGFGRLLIAGERLTFNEYLRRCAPYSTERELAAWLEAKSIRVMTMNEMQSASVDYPRILHHFETYFAEDIVRRGRTARTVAHDARQIAVLVGDLQRHERSVFVTADRKVRDAVAACDHQEAGSAMMSGVGLVLSIDLLVSALDDGQAMASLLWSTQCSSPAERIRRYLVDVALTQYDAALAMSMGTVVDELTESIVATMEKDRESVARNEGVELSLGRYVEAFEPQFYEKMRAEQERIRSRE